MPSTDAGCLEAALGYAATGWHVLILHGIRPGAGTGEPVCTCLDAECSSPGKHPRTSHGLKDATTDPEMIRAWFRRWPNSNVGLRTGLSFDVVDCDGTEGMNAWYQHCDDQGYAHRGPAALTGGGGMHVLVAPVPGQGNRAKFIDGCDYRGANGYIVAPPSIHASGKEYVWL